jgi:hypothetical protein
MKAYQAYATDAKNVTAATPRKAAVAFFEANPGKRKCNVTQGDLEGHFFVVTYGRKKEGDPPTSWKDVTKKTLQDIPDLAESTKFDTLT